MRRCSNNCCLSLHNCAGNSFELLQSWKCDACEMSFDLKSSHHRCRFGATFVHFIYCKLPHRLLTYLRHRLPLLSVSVYCCALAWHLTAWHCSFPLLPSLSLSVSAGIFVFNYFLKSRLIENCALLFEVFRLIKWSDKPVCKVFAVELAFLHSERERERRKSNGTETKES